ncbi:MAG: serine/threonine-protein kinase [Acidobacteria bacterium]|nr:serine/threonine-protein kinase [Acidobacteriota bacterium]
MTGQTISHYRILEKLGEGGMGAVYEAEDLKLRRHVALKFIPRHVLEDREIKVRFVREAQTAAALHHPNICTVFELDEEVGFLALELVKGPSLRDRIRERPLKLDEALRIAIQLGEALRVAHQAGIVHRDIKSANVLLGLDDQPKLTDFGLATLADSTRVTKTGTTIGTPGYMAPEQAAGEKLDRRTDLWSMGVVLYEMVTGRLPFAGDSEAAVVHAILYLQYEPLTAVRAGLPVELDRIVARCLAKDPDDRYQHADDLLVDLRRLSRPSAVTPAPVVQRQSRRGWLAAAVLGAALCLSLGWNLWVAGRTAATSAPPLRIALESGIEAGPPGTSDIFSPPAISPDGTKVVFSRDGALWLRELNRLEARRLDGTEKAVAPFWSPDSRQIAFSAGGLVKRIPAAGGEAVILGENRAGWFLGGAWSPRGQILLALADGIYSTTQQGGQFQLALAPDRQAGEQDFHRPEFLPDGESFVYSVHPRLSFKFSLYLRSKGVSRLILQDGINAAVDPSGFLLFERFRAGLALFAVPFATSGPAFAGDPVFLAANAAGVSVSGTGDLTFVTGPPAAAYELVVVSRDGKVLHATPGEYKSLRHPALSDDGNFVALSATPVHEVGIWLHDIQRGTRVPLTSGNSLFTAPDWLSGGKELAYLATTNERTAVELRDQTTGSSRVLLRSEDLSQVDPPSLSPDRRWVVFTSRKRSKPRLMVADPANAASANPWMPGDFSERNPRLSPDGRFLAYTSDATGSWEVYVQAFPAGGPRWQVSVSGGTLPRWTKGGTELVFVRDNSLWSVRVAPGSPPVFSAPELLLDGAPSHLELYSFSPQQSSYDISRDGQRIVAVRRHNTDAPAVVLMQNWRAQLGR